MNGTQEWLANNPDGYAWAYLAVSPGRGPAKVTLDDGLYKTVLPNGQTMYSSDALMWFADRNAVPATGVVIAFKPVPDEKRL